jgi:hypothetical protein
LNAFIWNLAQNRKLQFHLEPRDLSMVTVAGNIIIAEGLFTVSIAGGQPGTTAPTVIGTFRVKGSKILRE